MEWESLHGSGQEKHDVSCVFEVLSMVGLNYTGEGLGERSTIS